MAEPVPVVVAVVVVVMVVVAMAVCDGGGGGGDLCCAGLVTGKVKGLSVQCTKIHSAFVHWSSWLCDTLRECGAYWQHDCRSDRSKFAIGRFNSAIIAPPDIDPCLLHPVAIFSSRAGADHDDTRQGRLWVLT